MIISHIQFIEFSYSTVVLGISEFPKVIILENSVNSGFQIQVVQYDL